MNDQQDLEGLSALVTGATSGIGKAAAEELGRHGAEIVVHGRDADRGSAVVDTITAEGGKARFVAADRGIGRGDLRPAVRRQRPGGYFLVAALAPRMAARAAAASSASGAWPARLA